MAAPPPTQTHRAPRQATQWSAQPPAAGTRCSWLASHMPSTTLPTVHVCTGHDSRDALTSSIMRPSHAAHTSTSTPAWPLPPCFSCAPQSAMCPALQPPLEAVAPGAAWPPLPLPMWLPAGWPVSSSLRRVLHKVGTAARTHRVCSCTWRRSACRCIMMEPHLWRPELLTLNPH